MKKLLFIFVFCFIQDLCFAQIMYKNRYKQSVFVEVFGISPLISINYEYLPYRGQTSFVSVRGGLGFTGVSMMASGVPSIGFSTPIGASYNLMINGLRKRMSYRLRNRCQSLPPKITTEWFGELGLAYMPDILTGASTITHYAFGIAGIRQSTRFRFRGIDRTASLRITYNPAYYNNAFYYRSGIRIGISLGTSF